ncbi:MAG: chloride channel protein [Pseudomonadota bacterium]
MGGVTVGACAVGLAKLSDLAQHIFGKMNSSISWLPFLLTPAGFAICTLIARFWFPNSQGSGIPQTISAHRSADPAIRGKLLSLRIAAGKLVLTVFGLLCGASAGREGPTVQIGASIMCAAGKLAPRVHGGLIVAGSAAGIAAAFNAPLAGIMFGIEEMSRSFERRTSGLIIACVIAAGLTAQALLGDYSYFGSTSGGLGHEAWLAVAICGIFGGILGGTFSRVIIAISGASWSKLLRLKTHTGAVIFATVCGFGVVLCGTLSDNSTYGTGYSEVRAALDGAAPLSAAFMPLKLTATVLSSASGIPGGIFSPSLAVGAGLGSDISAFFPAFSVGLMMLLGMVAYLAGVVQAPMTAFIIVTEMTNDHAMLIPLMATAFLAHGASRLVCREGIYHALAKRFDELRLAPQGSE